MKCFKYTEQQGLQFDLDYARLYGFSHISYGCHGLTAGSYSVDVLKSNGEPQEGKMYDLILMICSVINKLFIHLFSANKSSTCSSYSHHK